MRKFTKEIAALIASAAVSAAVGAGSVSSEEIVQTAGVVAAPEEVISSSVDEDVLVEGLMMPEPTTMPPLAGEPLPPDEYIEETSEAQEQTGTVTITVINEETGKLFTENHKSFYVEGISEAPVGAGGGAHYDVGQFNPADTNPITFSEVPTYSYLNYRITYNGNFQEQGYSRYDIDYDKSTCHFNFKNSNVNNITIYMKYSEWGKNHPEEETTEEMPPLAGDMVLADGDINGDGEFNVADVVMLQKYLVGKTQTERMAIGNADMNGDGKVNVFDLVLLKRRLLEEIPTPPAEINPESWLREKYPEYFDLTASKGLEVYVFQTTPENYRCVLMEGTNRNKTDEEIDKLFLNSTSIDDMKTILSYYDIPETDIFIIPWQSPVWEYGYTIDDAYCAKLRGMFFGKNETISPSEKIFSPYFDPKEITYIGVSSLPENASNTREYFSIDKIEKIVSYLNGLHLQRDFSKNPDEYDGMTWEIRFVFKNGDKKTICLFGNMFYREKGSDWLRMNYDEAAAFDSLIYDNPSD